MSDNKIQKMSKPFWIMTFSSKREGKSKKDVYFLWIVKCLKDEQKNEKVRRERLPPNTVRSIWLPAPTRSTMPASLLLQLFTARPGFQPSLLRALASSYSMKRSDTMSPWGLVYASSNPTAATAETWLMPLATSACPFTRILNTCHEMLSSTMWCTASWLHLVW